MATTSKTYYHGYITIPKENGIDYLLPTTTINDVLVDSTGKTLNTVISEINNKIGSGSNIDTMTTSDIDAAFTSAGLS